MTDQIDSQGGQARRRSKALLIATSIFGVLYLIFFILSFIPAGMFGGVFGPGGSPVSSTVPFEPFDLEQIFVKLLFLLFLVGYIVVWKNEGIGGAVFILWYVAVWGVELLIVAPIKPQDWGVCIPVGLPLFVLGILFAVRWYKGRIVETVPPAS
jgi:hypothetical protein